MGEEGEYPPSEQGCRSRFLFADPDPPIFKYMDPDPDPAPLRINQNDNILDPGAQKKRIQAKKKKDIGSAKKKRRIQLR